MNITGMSKLLKALMFGFNMRMGIVGDEGGGADDGEAVGTGNDARVALLNQIGDANDSVRAGELRAVNDDDTTDDFIVEHADGTQQQLTDDTQQDETTQQELQRMADEANAQPEGQQQQQAEQTVTIKVNGREVTMPLSEALARAAKVESADQYLAEAARLRQEQEARARAAAQQEEEQNTVDEDLALARAIQMGSEEEAAAVIKKLRQTSPSITKDEIVRTVNEQLTFNEAISKFRSEYSDIVGDPILNQMAIDTDRKLIAAGDRRSYYERFADIGNELRNWMKTKATQFAPPPPPPQQGADKLARKAAAPQAPKPASQKTESSVEEEADETTSDIISKIAAARGGPQWMNGVSRH